MVQGNGFIIKQLKMKNWCKVIELENHDVLVQLMDTAEGQQLSLLIKTPLGHVPAMIETDPNLPPVDKQQMFEGFDAEAAQGFVNQVVAQQEAEMPKDDVPPSPLRKV